MHTDMHVRGTRAGTLVGALVLAAGLAMPAQAQVTYSTIALTGTAGAAGPGQGPGVTFGVVDGHQPSINAAGQVLFRAGTGAATSNNGLWLHTGGSNTTIVANGGPRPGGGTFSASDSYNSPILNSSGQIAFRLGASSGVFAGPTASLQRAALAADSAPGTGGALYSGVATGMPLFNDAGQIGFIGTLAASATSSPPTVTTSGIANTQGIWTGAPGAPTLQLRQNDALTMIDASGNTRVGTFGNLTIAMNGTGRYVTTANLQSSVAGTIVTGTGATSNSVALITNRAGSTQVLARVGDAAPDASGAASAEVYRTMPSSRIAFNNAGSVGFFASLRSGATQTAAAALFSDHVGGTMRQLTRAGSALPAIAGASATEFAGVTWGAGTGQVALNAQGTLAFSQGLANTGSTANDALLATIDSAGNFRRISRKGDVAVVNGSPISGDAFFNSFNEIAMNASGQIAFATNLTGNSVSVGLGNGSALFAWDALLGLQMVVRTGDLFQVAPGDVRTIATIGGLATSGGQDGRTIGLSDAGVLAFQLGFVGGGSGVFTATIPAPAGAGALALGLVALARRRR
jgi:hypothetical protein